MWHISWTRGWCCVHTMVCMVAEAALGAMAAVVTAAASAVIAAASGAAVGLVAVARPEAKTVRGAADLVAVVGREEVNARGRACRIQQRWLHTAGSN